MNIPIEELLSPEQLASLKVVREKLKREPTYLDSAEGEEDAECS